VQDLSPARTETLCFQLNGESVSAKVRLSDRLSLVLREQFELRGTKVGCDAGDCGACTVLLDGAPVCACLVAAGQVEGRAVVTVEGLGACTRHGAALQASFLRHGAAQCGICTPGMLVSGSELLERVERPNEQETLDALGGVLCRCTGYRKIVDAVMSATTSANAAPDLPETGAAVGGRIERLDGIAKVLGTEVFGGDHWPDGALIARAIRSPHHRARFKFGDLATFVAAHSGVVRVFTAADIPGENRFGVIPPLADQPALAEREVRFKGEAVALVVGKAEAMRDLDFDECPIAWEPLPPLLDIDAAMAESAPLVHAHRPGNILVRGGVVRGDVESALNDAAVTVEATFETGFVEHAYIEPESGYAERHGDRITVAACTQSPYLDRDDTARILGVRPEQVRIVPTAVGGGFGSKLDLSVQPFIALAAWHLNRPVRMVYTRPESILSTTKRHPSRISVRAGATADGKLVAVDVQGDFNTGAYASWGPTVANRVPVHASGPYYVPHYRALTRAIHTHIVPAGAFRGFGVPQVCLAQEQVYDELAEKLGIDKLEFRIANALRDDQPTVTGQVIGDGVGIRQCLEALRPHWRRALDDAARANRTAQGLARRGAGVAGMWYGCGNTSLANPSTIRIGLKANGRIALHQGAVDIGQGSNTVITQIAADALGLPIRLFDLVSPDTDLTPDCGKTSASRQTFVTGKAAELAARTLRQKMLRLANAGDSAAIALDGAVLLIAEGDHERRIDIRSLPAESFGYALMAEETFDPPTSPLDADGQGIPYAVYGFGAHLAEVAVDLELGTVKVLKITAAHDVGRAINPLLLEGQIEGGIAQGLGMALMEEFTPGRGENLHDYLIPTIGDMPAVESILIEEASPVGPFGAKGIGEQALIPTAPAIMNAIRHATGVRTFQAPAAPDRLRAAIRLSQHRS
jgi:CO/xanthine dehydrogenase Mo-binding subunit/aerobic-type carbon monoxide dehydrogenase small subunit (CoxS/CutS family)